MPVDPDSFLALTEKPLKPNQFVFCFIKGRKYSWFYLGTAVNVGYVVVDKNADEVISEIIHCRSVDSL